MVLLQRSLGLSQEQRKELAQLRQLFIVKLNVIMEQRREIHHTLMVSTRLQHTGVKDVGPPVLAFTGLRLDPACLQLWWGSTELQRSDSGRHGLQL